MNIGIIVYSQTGNTLSVTQKLSLTNLLTHQPRQRDFQITNSPVVDRYDLLVFGAPVQAFSLSPVMASYLDRLSALQGKKVACFVTKQLPFAWTGGNQAISKMKELCQEKGATIFATEIVYWSKSKDQNIDKCITNLHRQITNLYNGNID